MPEPRPMLTETPVVPGSDGRKMSKSYNNGIDLTESESSMLKKVRAMPTDPARVKREDAGDPTKCNVYAFHKLFSSPSDLSWVEDGCRTAGIGCGDCKGKLFENMNKLCAEPREKKKELLNNPKQLDSIIQAGCEKARQEAEKTMHMVRGSMGLK